MPPNPTTDLIPNLGLRENIFPWEERTLFLERKLPF